MRNPSINYTQITFLPALKVCIFSVISWPNKDKDMDRDQRRWWSPWNENKLWWTSAVQSNQNSWISYSRVQDNKEKILPRKDKSVSCVLIEFLVQHVFSANNSLESFSRTISFPSFDSFFFSYLFCFSCSFFPFCVQFLVGIHSFFLLVMIFLAIPVVNNRIREKRKEKDSILILVRP